LVVGIGIPLLVLAVALVIMGLARLRVSRHDCNQKVSPGQTVLAIARCGMFDAWQA
jgi:hypothetical protein